MNIKRLVHALTIIAFSANAGALLASPKMLITHNLTDVESNAFVAGNIPSQHPTKAHSDSKVSWLEVTFACAGHSSGGKCQALVKMETNTSHPVNLGWVTLDLGTGDITPKYLSANGYALTVNGPGETTLSKN